MSSNASNTRFAVAIMAAGKGTRLKSKRPKVLHRIGGKSLLEHVIAAAAQVVAPEDIYAIVGHEAARVREAVAHTGVRFVTQEPQNGTGHAVMCAAESLATYDFFLVLSGDVPLLKHSTISSVRDFHLAQGAAMTVLTFTPASAGDYGRIVRKDDSAQIAAIVERRSASDAQAAIRECNSGIYAFSTAAVIPRLRDLTTDNPHGEFYLTDVAAMLTREGERVVALPVENEYEVLGANTRAELAALDQGLRAAKCQELMDSGVTIFRPETCVIDLDVEVAPDTTIEPFVQLLGKTKIGVDCTVRSYSIVENCVLGDRVLVQPACMLREATIGHDAVLGPFAHVRPASEIGAGAHVGNFVELKKTKLGRGSKANHLSYLGDAVIGAGVNIGAGTITCNYDGKDKHTTTIEDGVFVGSDTTLVAPVTLGQGSYVAAASCITEDVPASSLALGRARQVVKQGWTPKKK